MSRKSQWSLSVVAFALIAGLLVSAFASAGSADLAQPGLLASATLTPTPTLLPTPSATPFSARTVLDAKRLYTLYMQLRSDIYGLNGYNALTGQYRDSYYYFLLGEQYHQHDTKILEEGLAYFDGLYGTAQAYERKATDTLAYPNGLNDGGQFVTSPVRVAGEIDYALKDFETSRSYYARAVYVLHSALNLYHQVSGLDTPEIPKLRLPVYCLPCRVR